ncbi:hypothetical protein M2416_003992 [Raoultella sp. BIGb0132]|nr:hypothetical protein [Raoultella sp. BIGb0132]MCS4290128.1 hypothetical protein [Raoultella terrigena]
MTPVVVERARRMLEIGATRQQVADVIGVGNEDDLQIFSGERIRTINMLRLQ